MVKKILKNKIYTEDFCSLEIESLKIDYLRFNLKPYLNDSEISNLAVYFRRLGFSSYKKERDNIKERTPIFNDKYFEVTFVLRTTYYEGTHLEFAGKSANHLYSFIKNNKFNWNQLEQYGTFLRRIDTCYDRPHKSIDKVTNNTFLEATLKHLKRVFPNNNLEYRRNRSGELINVGHRTSPKYYRVYLKGECLRFEFEHKDRKTLNLYDHFLKTKQFRKLEQRISYEFWKQTQHLFSYSQETEKVEWLAQRLRPFQTRNSLGDSGTAINIHYIQQCSMKKLQKQDLIRLFQLLAYLKLLDGYKTANLRSKFRQYKFPIREFLYFTNSIAEVNQYQLGKTIDFFNSLEHNLVFKFLADKDYRMLVTIPEAYAFVTSYLKKYFLDQTNVEELQLYRLLQFISFVRSYANSGRKEVVNHQIYITVEFYLVDFMKMIHAKQNTYQRKQFLEFFDNLMALPPYPEQFSDKEFRKLLFFPVVNTIQTTERGPWIIQVAVAQPLLYDFYPFHFPPSFFSYSSNINLQVKLSIIRSFAQEHSLQKTYVLQSFLNQYAKRSNSIQAQVKREILQEFQNLLKYEIIQPKFEFSVDGNHFIQKHNIQLEDIRSYKVICFQEIIHY